jgi:hypothetical protein
MRKGLVDAVCLFKRDLQAAIPGAILTFNTAYYIQGNQYNFTQIANCVDFIMPEVGNSAWKYNASATRIPYGCGPDAGECKAGAFYPLDSMADEFAAYVAAGIPPSKIAPLFPWSGRRSRCDDPHSKPGVPCNLSVFSNGEKWDYPNGGWAMKDGVWDSHGMEYGRVMRMLQDGVDAPVGPWEMSGLNDRYADNMQLPVLSLPDTCKWRLSAGFPMHRAAQVVGQASRGCTHEALRQYLTCSPHHQLCHAISKYGTTGRCRCRSSTSGWTTAAFEASGCGVSTFSELLCAVLAENVRSPHSGLPTW